VMIPLTISKQELAYAHAWVEEALAELGADDDLDVLFGTMIETPRAALMAMEIAEIAEFFSFGTNDLTQLTYGFSRDDVESKLMPIYLAQGLLPSNPFKVVDAEGVVELMNIAVKRARSTRPDIKLGVCGEHGGDAESIASFVKLGLDYVSCSPYRVPIARLAVAQSLIREGASL
jgi:pyruvate,orthophosphate dikinase